MWRSSSTRRQLTKTAKRPKNVPRWGNEYRLIPGKTYDKDPKVTVVANSEDCWLFVKLENGLVDITGATTIEDQMKANGWTVIDAAKTFMRIQSIASANTDVDVFETFTLAEDAAVEDYKTAEIVVTAYAVQADGFDTAEKAWNATFGAPAQAINGKPHPITSQQITTASVIISFPKQGGEQDEKKRPSPSSSSDWCSASPSAARWRG